MSSTGTMSSFLLVVVRSSRLNGAGGSGCERVDEAHPVLEPPDAFDLAGDDVAVGEEAGRIKTHPDAARRPHGDQVARLERHDGRDDGDGLVDPEDHVTEQRVLAELAVHPGADPTPFEVRDRLPRHDERADRCRPRERLAEEPLAMAALQVP